MCSVNLLVHVVISAFMDRTDHGDMVHWSIVTVRGL